MREQLVSYETAVLAKQKGFNLYCIYSYWNNQLTTDTPGYSLENGETSQDNYFEFKRYYVPTQALLQRWLREKHDIHIVIDPVKEKGKLVYYGSVISDNVEEEVYNTEGFDTYEECLEDALLDGLNLI